MAPCKQEFGEALHSGENLTVDEQLVPYRGRVSFKQHMPSNPDKYGMKIWWICDSTTSYPLSGIPYLGREGADRGVNLATRVVEQLCEPYERTNRNITMDNFFTSFELTQSLISKGLTCVGTLRKNKRCIPNKFLPNKQRDPESNIFGFRKNITIGSYVPKRNRSVILLSSLHHSAGTDPSNKNKSEINLYYNATKGGVDTLDQMCHAYTARRKTWRWPMAQFYNIIDVCGIAAKVIWLNLYPDWNKTKSNSLRKLFLKELAQDLVVPNIKRRSTIHLTRPLKLNISDVLEQSSDNMETDDMPPVAKRLRRCYTCPSNKGRACCKSNVVIFATKMFVKSIQLRQLFVKLALINK